MTPGSGREEREEDEWIASPANRAGPPLLCKNTVAYPSGVVYEGEYLAGKKHGKGKSTHPNGNVYEGGWRNDKRHGEGTYTFDSGEMYEGQWLGDNIHGEGKYTSTSGEVYEGQWLNNKRQGQGKDTYANGDEMYKGQWFDNKWHGQGKFTHSNGDVYEGGWRMGKKHGKGKFTSPNVIGYEGQWLNDKMHGQGTLTHADGGVFEGQWLDSKMHGQGKVTHANGDVYEGQWLDDHPIYDNGNIAGLIQVTVANGDTRCKTKHICSSDTTLGCFLKGSTQNERPHKKYFRVVHKKRTLFLSSSGKETLESLGIEDGDEVAIGGLCPLDNNGSPDSPKIAKKASKSELKSKKSHNNPKGSKQKPAAPNSYVASNKKQAELHKQDHSKSMNPVLEEMGPRLKLIRDRLNNLNMQKTAPKEKCHNTKTQGTPQAASTCPSADVYSDHAKKAGKAIYPILVGEATNLYKTSRVPHGHLPPIDLHRCSKEEALEKLGKKFSIWVETAMQGKHPWVLGVDIVCGGGNQILSDVVNEWICVNHQVANRPKGVH